MKPNCTIPKPFVILDTTTTFTTTTATIHITYTYKCWNSNGLTQLTCWPHTTFIIVIYLVIFISDLFQDKSIYYSRRQIYILYQKFIYSHYHRKLYKTFSSQCTRKFYNLIVVPTSFEYYIRRDLFCLWPPKKKYTCGYQCCFFVFDLQSNAVVRFEMYLRHSFGF